MMFKVFLIAMLLCGCQNTSDDSTSATPNKPITTVIPSPTQTPNQAPIVSSDFVTRIGKDLYLKNKLYYFSGTNQYYLFYKSQKMVDDIIDTAANMGLNVIRTWGFCDGAAKEGYAFQVSPGKYDETTFRKMDYTIYKASQHNIKLIIPLVNNWDEMGGMMQYAHWANSSNHDDFYTNQQIKQVYKEYVKYFLTRINSITGVMYKDDPTIAVWELANEPRSQQADIFQSWIEEMSAYFKTIDTNHLLSIGDEGWAYAGNDWVANNKVKDIDIVSFHLYPDSWGYSNEDQAKNWIVDHLEKAKTILNKPAYMGEFGIRDKSKRDRIYGEWYDLAINKGMPGIVFWLLSGHQDDGSLYPDYDGLTVYPNDSTATVIKYKSVTFLNR